MPKTSKHGLTRATARDGSDAGWTYRNPVLCPDGVSYDCEVLHEIDGWIPFTATAHDPEPHGRELHAQIHAGLALNPNRKET